MATQPEGYAARLDIDYPERLDRFTSFFRVIWVTRGVSSTTSSEWGGGACGWMRTRSCWSPTSTRPSA